MFADEMEKDYHKDGYKPPVPAPVRSVAKGRFNIAMNTPAQLFEIDQKWQKTANPEYFQKLQARNDWDIKMMKKKRQQKLDKEKF